MRPDHHLAQLNIGRLLAPSDDLRVRDFMSNIERVNSIGKRSPGFVWIMEGAGEPGLGNTETCIDGDPQFVSNLTVWTNVAALEDFVWNTVHRQFYERRAEWFEVLGQQHFVMWWVPVGHIPILDEGLARLSHLQAHGASEHAFGWNWLAEAKLWKQRACRVAAAE